MSAHDSLTADQTEKVVEFQSVTGVEDFGQSCQILRSCDWNVERAVQMHMAVLEGDEQVWTLPTVQEVANLHRAQRTSPRLPRRPPPTQHFGEGTRDVAPAPLQAHRWGIVGAGLGFIGTVAGAIWGFASSLARPLLTPFFGAPRAGPSGAAAAAAFITEFERSFGTTHPRFFEGSFNEAATVAKNQSRLLLVYLHSGDHPAVLEFCRGTLAADGVASFLDENFVVYGADVSAPEGYRIGNVLGASSYPFIAIVANLEGTPHMSVLQRFEGVASPEELTSHLSTVLEQYGETLRMAVAQTSQRDADRRIREEQDAAFRASLAADQERDRRLREEREAAEAEERRREEEARALQNRSRSRELRRERALAALRSEPPAGPHACRIRFMLPQGERVDRRFVASDTVQDLYTFVESHDLGETDDYVIVMAHPRTEFGDRSLTLSQASLFPHGAQLLVQPR